MLVNNQLVCIYRMRSWHLFIIFLIIFLVTAVQAQDPQPHERVQVLELHRLKGKIPGQPANSLPGKPHATDYGFMPGFGKTV